MNFYRFVVLSLFMSSSAVTISHDQVYGLFGALIAADIWWSWRTIRNNGRRFTGHAAEGTPLTSDFFLIPVKDGGQMAWRLAF